MASTEDNDLDRIEMTADIVSAYLSKNNVALSEITRLIDSVHTSLGEISDKSTIEPVNEPAVPIGSSVQADYIVCLEDGRKMKMLKRHLRTDHGMTPEEYRSKWNLPSNYPMVSSNYSKVRSGLAKKIGLGSENSKRKNG